jgi:hypothetical protein
MHAFLDLLERDSKALWFAATARIYMGRRMATGEFEFECSSSRHDGIITGLELIIAALEEDRRTQGDLTNQQ